MIWNLIMINHWHFAGISKKTNWFISFDQATRSFRWNRYTWKICSCFMKGWQLVWFPFGFPLPRAPMKKGLYSKKGKKLSGAYWSLTREGQSCHPFKSIHFHKCGSFMSHLCASYTTYLFYMHTLCIYIFITTTRTLFYTIILKQHYHKNETGLIINKAESHSTNR